MVPALAVMIILQLLNSLTWQFTNNNGDDDDETDDNDDGGDDDDGDDDYEYLQTI